jgi:excisionase family DNA binding protein
MRLTPGQLSLLEVDDEPQSVPRKKSPAKRQKPTLNDKPREKPQETCRRPARPSPVASALAPDRAALLTTGEAAKLLHVHPRTVQRLVERGQLCAVHLGSAVRFDPHDVMTLIEDVKRERAAPAEHSPLRARHRASSSFAERLRSKHHEHRTTQT